jgi:enoyl-CoA hydratase/carnithine racemase
MNNSKRVSLHIFCVERKIRIMEYVNLKYEKENKIAVVTLSRPKALNAISYELAKEFEDVLVDIEKDDNVQAFIVTGGPRADGRPCFCAGGDLKAVQPANHRKPEEQIVVAMEAMITGESARQGPGATTMMEDLNKSSKLSIAAIDGICTAGGLEIALGCDLILVAETAQISDMHLKNLGMVGGAALSTKLARRIPVSKAIQLCVTGDVIDGKEAHRILLADEVFPRDKLMDKAKELARKVATMRPAGIRLTRASCKAVYDMSYYQSHRFQDVCCTALEFDSEKWRAQRWGGKR